MSMRTFGNGLFALCAVVLLLPIALGLWHTLLPALGYFPLLGEPRFTLASWQAMLLHPSFFTSLQVSLISGLLACLLSLLLSLWLASHCYWRPVWRRLQASLMPMIALPHVALAIGLVFVLAPSGWWLRLVSPSLSGFNYPPPWFTVQDNYGLSLALALLMKELPFVLWMTYVSCSQLPVRQTLHFGQSVGFSPSQVWWRLLVPQILPRLRLPMMAALAFALSVVDVAQVIGPSQPPSFAVLIWQWYNDANLNMRMLASSAAFFLLGLIGGVLGLYYLCERLSLALLLRHALNAQRKQQNSGLITLPMVGLFAALMLSAFVVLLLWSLSGSWRFPHALPSSIQWQTWAQVLELGASPFTNSLLLALASSALSLALVIACLELEPYQPRLKLLSRWIYVPLLLPQIAFLFGLQQQMIRLGGSEQFWGVVWAHMLFVFPYIYLSLATHYRHFDTRFMYAAISLSQSHWRSWCRVKLPMLAAPITMAFAMGFAVSISQYLPTLFIGGGRFNSLTTEAVALASGGNRRIAAMMALLQSVLPLLVLFGAWRMAKNKEEHVTDQPAAN